MKRIGILGGTFDPIHIGHLILAENARQTFELDQILFIPANIPPHKQTSQISAGTHRLAMIKCAIADNEHFAVSDYELTCSDVSYTLHTIEHLQQQQPEAQFFFILGYDNLRDLHTWYKAEALISRCEFIVVARPGYSLDNILEQTPLSTVAQLRLAQNVMTSNEIDVSASEIRDRVRAGKSIKYLVPTAVSDYIYNNHLYTT